MGFQNPFIFTNQARDGNRLRRGKGEVVEDSPVRHFLAILNPCGLQFRRQFFTCGRMLILTQPQKIFGADFPGQSQSFRAQPNPFAGHTLTLIIVITDAEMFLEVFLRVFQVVLCLGRDHATDINRTVRASCVADTSSCT